MRATTRGLAEQIYDASWRRSVLSGQAITNEENLAGFADAPQHFFEHSQGRSDKRSLCLRTCPNNFDCWAREPLGVTKAHRRSERHS